MVSVVFCQMCQSKCQNNCHSNAINFILSDMMSSDKPAIVSGEAPETDSEDEYPDIPQKIVPTVQGAAISGEDSESENEIGTGVSSAVSALSPTTPDETTLSGKTHESLLHKKLRECNTKLHKDLGNFVNGMVDESSKSLSAIEQQLLKSQLTLQSAVSSLRSLNVNSSKIRNKLQTVISSVFIPNINVDK